MSNLPEPMTRQQVLDDFVAGGEDFHICYKIDGNGPYHYREHREWIRELLPHDDDA